MEEELDKWIDVPSIDAFKDKSGSGSVVYNTNCKCFINGVEAKDKYYAKLTFNRHKMTTQIVIFNANKEGAYIYDMNGLITIKAKLTYANGRQETLTDNLLSMNTNVEENLINHGEDSYFIKFINDNLPQRPSKFTFRIIVNSREREKLIEYIFEIND